MIQGIIELLKQSDALKQVTGLNSTGQKLKVYPVVCPQTESAPYITVFETSKPPIRCKDGLTGYRFTANIVCYASDYEDTYTMAEAVQSCIDGKSGSFGGTDFKIMNYDTRSDAFNEESQLYMKIVTVSGMIG